jgi:serpin B
MMKQENILNYLQTNDFQSVILPYGDSNRYEMDIFLPNNLSNFIKTLSISNWDKWMGEYGPADGVLLLPRFKLNYSNGLKDSLTKLGMGVAFDKSKADLSGIAHNLYINEVFHISYVNVDEQGTEASAASIASVNATSAMNEPAPFNMNVDRSFFFAIRDSQTGEVLFIGVVNKP